MQSTRSSHKRKGGIASTIGLLLLGTLLLAGVAVYCYTQLVPNIEADIKERVSTELANNGLTTAQVQVNGTTVVLSGRNSSGSTAQKIKEVALGVYGVSEVQNKLDEPVSDSNNKNDNVSDEVAIPTQSTGDSDNTIIDGATTKNQAETDNNLIGNSESDTPITDFSGPEVNAAGSESPWIPSILELVVNDEKASVSGVLPDTTMVLRVASAVAEEYGSDNTDNKISIVPTAVPPTWLEGAITIINRIDNITNPSLLISDNAASLGGFVSSETLGAQQLSAAKRALGNEIEVSATFTILPTDSELPAPKKLARESKKRPASLKVEGVNGTLRIAGTVSSVEEAEAIRFELDELFESTKYTDELIIDDSVATANWVSEALAVTSNVKDVPNFSVSINSGQMMLRGDVENRESGKTLVGTASKLVNNKLKIVNNYTVSQARLVIESREEALSRALAQELAALDTSKIVFNPGSTQLVTEAIEVLDSVAVTITSYEDQVVEISGHTDASGDSVSNLELSKKRAMAVRDYLVSKGLPSNRLRPIGYGESSPVADNSTPAGRAANRRIEFNL